MTARAGGLGSRDGTGLGDGDPGGTTGLAGSNTANVLGFVLHNTKIVSTKCAVTIDKDVVIWAFDVVLDFMEFSGFLPLRKL